MIFQANYIVKPTKINNLQVAYRFRAFMFNNEKFVHNVDMPNSNTTLI